MNALDEAAFAARDHSVRRERIPWEYVPKHYRKGYIGRDFFVNGRWYRPFAAGSDDVGLVTYGALMGTLDDYRKNHG